MPKESVARLKSAFKREWLEIVPRAVVAAVLVGGSMYGLAPITSPNINPRTILDVFVPDLSHCADARLPVAELSLHEDDTLVARIFIETTKPCELTLKPIINENVPLEVAVLPSSSTIPKILPAIETNMLSSAFMGAPALVERVFKTGIPGPRSQIIYTFKNCLNHRTYSKSLLYLAFTLGDTSMAPFSALMRIPVSYDVSSPDTPVVPSILTVMEQSVNLRVANQARTTLFLDNLQQAQRRDSLILLCGALFGTGAALLAEAVAASIRLSLGPRGADG